MVKQPDMHIHLKKRQGVIQVWAGWLVSMHAYCCHKLSRTLSVLGGCKSRWRSASVYSCGHGCVWVNVRCFARCIKKKLCLSFHAATKDIKWWGIKSRHYCVWSKTCYHEHLSVCVYMYVCQLVRASKLKSRRQLLSIIRHFQMATNNPQRWLILTQKTNRTKISTSWFVLAASEGWHAPTLLI